MNEQSINLLRNLCRAGPFPGKTMLDAIYQFQAHVPALLADAEAAERKAVLAVTAEKAALAKLSVAKDEVRRLRGIVQKAINVLHEAKDNGSIEGKAEPVEGAPPKQKRGRPPKAKAPAYGPEQPPDDSPSSV